MSNLKEIILENWGLKLTALLLSVTLWLAVHGDPGVERTITVPVEIHNLARNMEITSERPNSVDVTIRGSGVSMWFTQPAPACVIDLLNAEEGERIVPLGPENLRIPRGLGLEVVAVRPVRFRLTLERRLSKEVPVVVLLEGQPADGFEIYGRTHAPVTARISGPRSRVEKISEVKTEAISVQGRRQSVRQTVSLNIRDSLVHSTSVDQVEVQVEIGARRKMVTITQVPVVPDDTTISVSPSRVSVQVLIPETFRGTIGAEDLIATVSARKLELTLPLVKVKPDVSFARPVAPGVRIEGIEPPVVTLRRTDKS